MHQDIRPQENPAPRSRRACPGQNEPPPDSAQVDSRPPLAADSPPNADPPSSDRAVEQESAIGCIFRLVMGVYAVLLLLKLILGIFPIRDIDGPKKRPHIGPHLNERATPFR
jgi:hypothetical protein